MLWLLFFFGVLTLSNCQELPNSCTSPIYCYGELLHTVQLAHLQDDSKTFVDLKMKNSQKITLENFQKLLDQTQNKPTKEQIRTFVNGNFEEGKELGNWTLPDFNSSPDFVNRITNETVKNFTQELILKWPELARHVKDEVSKNPEQYSLIPVPNGFIVPGGRFREYYYWDSYWIVDGLLLNEMPETARGMIENFISLVKRYGFVPNGGRVYYLKRSQPPLLTPMAHLYYQHTKNTTWLKNNIDALAIELKYWIKQTVNIQKDFITYTLAHYNAPSAGPRPESYREDIRAATYYENPTEQQQVYTDLKSGAESGWDFSARWIFDRAGGIDANLTFIQTRRVIPVDLNAFLCGAFRDISELYTAIEKPEESDYWQERYLHFRNGINAILWDEDDGVWYDYDTKLKKHRRKFYPSGVTPLWSRCFDETKGEQLGKRVLDYLLGKNVLEYLGGIPASDDNTGEQWDFPNAWPPLQDIVVRGLENSGHAGAKEEAEILAGRWIASNVIGYQETGVIYEKYHAVYPGQYGIGGEYEVQPGFGWSNGVALRFIHDYYTTPPNTTTSNTTPPTTTPSDNGSKRIEHTALFWVILVTIKLFIM